MVTYCKHCQEPIVYGPMYVGGLCKACYRVRHYDAAHARTEAEGRAHFKTIGELHMAILQKAEGWTAEQRAQLFRREDEE